MQISVSDIAKQTKGVVKGDGSSIVRGAAGLGEASATDISFLKDVKDAAAIALLGTSKAAAVFVPKNFDANGRTVIEVDNPQAAFAHVLGLVAKEAEVRPEGVHPTAVVHPTAKIGAQVRIGAHSIVEAGAVIGDRACLMGQNYVGARSKVGDDTLLYPQVVLREDVTVGKRCILHAAAVIGSDGYGYYFADGRHNKIPQVGTVIIEDDVEIGSCTAIDRATTGATRVGRGTKIDNLVQVAHNVQIGPLCLLVSQVGIAGSTTLGAGVILAGQTGVADHVKIGDGVKCGARTGINRDIPAGSTMWGGPAQPINDELRQIALLRRLPEIAKDVKKLKEKLDPNV
jgi:UDP-3-O-[3-hydroxymyristoyl] glucosamine N-acyltransferase